MRRRLIGIVGPLLLIAGLYVVAASPAYAHGTCTALASKPTVVAGQNVVGAASWACTDANGNVVKHASADWTVKLQRRAITGGTWGPPPSGAHTVFDACSDCGKGGSSIIGQIANCNGYEYRMRIVVDVSGHSTFSDNSAPASC